MSESFFYYLIFFVKIAIKVGNVSKLSQISIPRSIDFFALLGTTEVLHEQKYK